LAKSRAGVYKINCDDCQKFYIGQTTRSFGQRFKGHVPSRKSNLKSTFASHLVNNNHNYTGFEENMKILHFHNKKGRYLDCLEEFEIYRTTKTEPDNLLNEQTSFKSNIIYDAAIELSRLKTTKGNNRHATDNG
jgi:predicted GIY-YIG superfamily endonuclease